MVIAALKQVIEVQAKQIANFPVSTTFRLLWSLAQKEVITALLITRPN